MNRDEIIIISIDKNFETITYIDQPPFWKLKSITVIFKFYNNFYFQGKLTITEWYDMEDYNTPSEDEIKDIILEKIFNIQE